MKNNDRLNIDYSIQELNIELTQIISERNHSTKEDIQSLRKDSKLKISEILSKIESLSENNKSKILIKTLTLVNSSVSKAREEELSQYINSVFNDEVGQEFEKMKYLDEEVIKQLINIKKENIRELKEHIESPYLSRQEAQAYSMQYRKVITKIIQYSKSFIKSKNSPEDISVIKDFEKELKKLKRPIFKQRIKFGVGAPAIISNFFKRLILANSIKIGSWIIFVFISLMISTPALIFYLLRITKRKHVGLHSILIDVANKLIANIPVIKKLSVSDIENHIYELIWSIKPTGNVNKYKITTAKEIEVKSNLAKAALMNSIDIEWRVKEQTKEKRKSWESNKEEENE